MKKPGQLSQTDVPLTKQNYGAHFGLGLFVPVADPQ
jgi:hypothetical protein